ncbi:hypothetical protein HPB51_024606 [Rhipicephalus microplus]|uniref:HTH CENPB-type domain-containing protein n=1 Tax=Rhipicephalus microplus TaxID=6941 RepID=A0A9J6EDE1_RHIMP|nr:hypothetical protein HPB51_024606 [Rhipicephalus microplus]
MAENAPEKRKAILIGTKVDIIRDIRMGMKNVDAAKKYSLSNSTVALTNLSGGEKQRKRVREATYKELEDALLKWFLDARQKNIPISGLVLLKIAGDLAFFLRHENFKPRGRWLQFFKEHHGIVYRAVVGEAAAVNEDAGNDWLSADISAVL